MTHSEIKVLIVDDDETVHELCRASLRADAKNEWIVRTARGVDDAMAIASDWGGIGIVAIDYRLGKGINGIDLMKIIRGRVGEGTALVILTGNRAAVRNHEVNLASGVCVIDKTPASFATLGDEFANAIEMHKVHVGMLTPHRRATDDMWEPLMNLVEISRANATSVGQLTDVVSKLAVSVDSLASKRRGLIDLAVDGVKYTVANPSAIWPLTTFILIAMIALINTPILPALAKLISK